jgi:hypothetical protein
MNVPDFWKKEETHWPLDFLHFGSDAYHLCDISTMVGNLD